MNIPVEQLIDDHITTTEALKASVGVVEQCAAMLIEAFKSGGRLYIMGNGGSAADAQHIAAELVGRFKRSDKPALPAIALTTDSSTLTAIGNDYGFHEVFKRQVEGLVQAGDVVWALSVSGTSANVVKAMEVAKRQGAKIIAFTGQEGTLLQSRSDVCLMAEHIDSDRVQEVHQLAYHIICGIVEEAFV